MTLTTQSTIKQLQQCAVELKWHGLLAHWDELDHPTPHWLIQLLNREQDERHKRGLQRRIRNARLGAFKPLADFDWQWPEQLDQATLLSLMSMDFMQQDKPLNPIFIGGNGIGKTTLAKNIRHYWKHFKLLSKLLTFQYWNVVSNNVYCLPGGAQRLCRHVYHRRANAQ